MRLLLLAIVSTLGFVVPTHAQPDPCGSEISARTTGTWGYENARSVDIRVQDTSVRITLALKNPRAESSSVIIQIFYPQVTNSGLTLAIEQQLTSLFERAQPDVDINKIKRITTQPVDRETFRTNVNKLTVNLARRFKGNAQTLRSVSPLARSASAQVAEAARQMTQFLRRRKVVRDPKVMDRLLNRAHTRLINDLSENELRFFDYALFDEVLPFETDERLRATAENLKDLLPPRDLDVARVHEDIRKRFVTIAQEVLRRQRIVQQPLMEELKTQFATLVWGGQQMKLARQRLAFTRNLPFSEEAFEKLATWSLANEVSEDNVSQVWDLTEDLAMLPLSAWQYDAWRGDKDMWITARSTEGAAASILKLADILLKSAQFEASNEPIAANADNGRLYVRVVEVVPGNGGFEGGAMDDLGTGMNDSLLSQPRRSNPARHNSRRDEGDWN